MINKILIEPHYLGSLEYYICLLNADEIVLEINDHYIKQTYRTRCYVLSPQGIELLSVPVNYNNRTKYKDLTIDYSQSWLKDHKRALSSYYGNAPFFDYFWDLFRVIWERKHKHLLDMSLDFMTLCLKIMQIDRPISFTEAYNMETEKGIFDLRNIINPKKEWKVRDIYQASEYTQIFGNNFAANLSIIDLLLCEGSRSVEILRKSSVGSRNK